MKYILSIIDTLKSFIVDLPKSVKTGLLVVLGFIIPLIVIGVSTNQALSNAKQNRETTAYNKKQASIDKNQLKLNNSRTSTTFASTFNEALSKSFVGDYSSSDRMWDYAHNESPIKGLEALMGKDKDYYKSTYNSSASSSISSVQVSQFGSNFTAMFNYRYASLLTSGNTQTQETIYTVYGHRTDDNNWQVDKILTSKVK